MILGTGLLCHLFPPHSGRVFGTENYLWHSNSPGASYWLTVRGGMISDVCQAQRPHERDYSNIFRARSVTPESGFKNRLCQVASKFGQNRR